MKLIAKLLTLFVALSHVGIMILEMFFWNHPVGQRIFAMTPEVAAASEVLAMNQGLYNGFLAAGLFGGLLRDRFDTIVFFLCCVVVAGIFGAATAKFSILFTQGLPAFLALVAVIMSRDKFAQ
jgi:putative membrane protein